MPDSTMVESTSQVQPAALPWHGQINNAVSQDQFSAALQDLKNVRNHLYSAALYYESAYIHSDQKLAVFQSLREYSAKAIINAVDHVGTVACQLNESLLQQADRISNVEACTSLISQRISSCQGGTNSKALNRYHFKNARPNYYKHYNIPDTTLETKPQSTKHGSKENVSEISKDSSGSDVYAFKPLSWYLSSQLSPLPSKRPWKTRNRSTSPSWRTSDGGNKVTAGNLSRSLSSGRIRIRDHTFHGAKPISKGSPSGSSRSLLSLMLSDEEGSTSKRSTLRNLFERKVSFGS